MPGLDTADVDGNPLGDRDARDWAVRDYRSHLAAVLKRGNATIDNALAAIDDFYARLPTSLNRCQQMQYR